MGGNKRAEIRRPIGRSVRTCHWGEGLPSPLPPSHRPPAGRNAKNLEKIEVLGPNRRFARAQRGVSASPRNPRGPKVRFLADLAEVLENPHRKNRGSAIKISKNFGLAEVNLQKPQPNRGFRGGPDAKAWYLRRFRRQNSPRSAKMSRTYHAFASGPPKKYRFG